METRGTLYMIGVLVPSTDLMHLSPVYFGHLLNFCADRQTQTSKSIVRKNILMLSCDNVRPLHVSYSEVYISQWVDWSTTCRVRGLRQQQQHIHLHHWCLCSCMIHSLQSVISSMNLSQCLHLAGMLLTCPGCCSPASFPGHLNQAFVLVLLSASCWVPLLLLQIVCLSH